MGITLLEYSIGEITFMSNIMILNGSFRPNAFTKAMIESFRNGAIANKNHVTVIDLRKMNIHSCIGCLSGGKYPEHPCTQSDDMDYVYDIYRQSDVVVFATPLFFWSYSGLLKNAIDRLWALAECEKDELHGNNKSGVLLVAAGGSHPEQLLNHFDYLMERLSWTNLGKAVLLHTDEMDIGKIPEIMDAYNLGVSIT